MHTAVKIAPQYESIDHPVIHVLDASRSVVVVGNLLEKNADKRDDYVEDTLDLYDEMREDYYAGLEERNLLSFDQAIKKRLSIDWAKEPCADKPVKPGIHVEKNYPLSKLCLTSTGTPSSKRGNYVVATQIGVSKRYSMTTKSVKKQKNFTTMPRQC